MQDYRGYNELCTISAEALDRAGPPLSFSGSTMTYFDLIAETCQSLHGLRGSAALYFLARLNKPVVVVTCHARRLDEIRDTFLAFRPRSRAYTLPPLDGSPFSAMPIHPSTKRTRLMCFDAILKNEWDFIVTLPRTFLELLPGPEHLARPRLRFEVGDSHDLTDLTHGLTAMGYTATDLVTQPGDFAKRGGILDIYSVTHEKAFRLDFFDDEIEEIRLFDPSTQRATGTVRELEVLPVFEWVLDEARAQTFAKKGAGLWNQTSARDHFLEMVGSIRDRGRFPGYLHWTALFFEQTRHFFELLKGETLFFIDDWEEVQEAQEAFLSQLSLENESARSDSGPHADSRTLFGMENPSAITLPPNTEVLKHHHLHMEATDRDFATQTVPQYNNDVYRFLAQWKSQIKRLALVLVCRTKGTLARFEELIEEEGAFAHRISFPLDTSLAPGFYLGMGQLDTGFSWPELKMVVISESDIWPQTNKTKRKVAGMRVFESEFQDLKTGDLVVHRDHGIGRFLGLVEMHVGGGPHEMMAIEYRGDQRLYVHLNQLDLVQRHGSGSSGVALDRLGGVSWAKTKSRVKKAVREMAGELLRLYASRKVVDGHIYQPDTQWQAEFEDSFEHEPTEGQLSAIEEIKKDMESEKPMDRLLVGDVGFGKTEVAMRMAFKAVMEGLQVAVLCPTTVLAFQHSHTFRNRFAAFPVQIAWLSRFSTPKHVKSSIKLLTEGKIDILIGTHRILSKDVRFKNLGALIIDEEQRFGVSHKERLKQMRKRLDVLSMSATPIPRTLNMSLSGIRDISVIETPPRNRLAISTTVAESRDVLIKNAIEFELERNGQVFFIHNRVETMETVVAGLKRLVPNAEILMAHGRMESKSIEKAMLGFMKREADILVASTIIENGVDIPNANTMIVNRADMFGMSQLYQLRGRIGRSDRPAYAYLLVPPRSRMAHKARRRLAVLEEFSDLGSGFRIAAKDMELRGAGNLLGGEQAGHIHAIGYEMYIKLLEEAVHDLKGEPIEDEIHCLVKLELGSAIPKNYIEDTNQRLHYYKKLAGAKQEKDLALLKETMIDCYGPLPGPTGHLVAEHELRLFLSKKRIVSVEREKRCLKICFHKEAEVNADLVLAWVLEKKALHLSPEGVLTLLLESRKADDVPHWIRQTVTELTSE